MLNILMLTFLYKKLIFFGLLCCHTVGFLSIIYFHIYISGKVDKSKTCNRFSGNILFFIHRISSSDSVNKEHNITKPIVSI